MLAFCDTSGNSNILMALVTIVGSRIKGNAIPVNMPYSDKALLRVIPYN